MSFSYGTVADQSVGMNGCGCSCACGTVGGKEREGKGISVRIGVGEKARFGKRPWWSVEGRRVR